MKFLIKSMVLLVAWAHLLTCVAPSSPCYGMGEEEPSRTALSIRRVFPDRDTLVRTAVAAACAVGAFAAYYTSPTEALPVAASALATVSYSGVKSTLLAAVALSFLPGVGVPQFDSIEAAQNYCHPPFHHEAPELNENARALKESIDCGRAIRNRAEGSSYPLCPVDVMQRWPNYNQRPDTIKSFYDNITFVGTGGEYGVYSAILKQAREDVAAGTKIALRLRTASQCLGDATSLPIRQGLSCSLPRALIAYSQLARLKSRAISEYYPDMYGVYYGPSFPLLEPEIIGKRGEQYVEMEFVDTFFDSAFRHHKIPDNVVFEQCLGEWATRKISRIHIDDAKWRHYGLKEVNYSRAYHIGEEIYLFGPGKTPKRVDLDIFGYPTEQDLEEKFRPHFAEADQIESANAREAYTRMGDEGIFNVFSKYFSDYKVSKQDIDLYAPVKHYFVPAEHLGDM